MTEDAPAYGPPKRTVIVIPARFQSSRFPGKPLVPIMGVDKRSIPLVQWVHEAAMRSTKATEVVVATDSLRIREEVIGFGGAAIMTPDCLNGTERAMHAARALGLDSGDLVINWQGDAPLVPADAVDRLIRRMGILRPGFVGTLVCHAVEGGGEDGRVHVVTDADNRARSFSRTVVPFPAKRTTRPPRVFSHIGIYAYRAVALAEYGTWPEGEEEHREGLEQLRWIQHDVPIHAVLSTVLRPMPEVNYPHDIERVEEAMRQWAE